MSIVIHLSSAHIEKGASGRVDTSRRQANHQLNHRSLGFRRGEFGPTGENNADSIAIGAVGEC
jgi:hypothetical protein